MSQLFDLTDRVIVVTGATGALAGSIADYLVTQHARVVYVGRSQDKLDAAVAKVQGQGQAMAVVADVLDRAALERAKASVLAKWGRIDGLINAAGGNQPGATISPEKSFFDLNMEAFSQVIELNLQGTVLPALVFGPAMLGDQHGRARGAGRS